MKQESAQIAQEQLDNRELFWQVLSFYIPLAVSAMIMMSSHSVVNSALSRTLRPEAALAAYAVAQSVTNMFASPNFTGRQMLVALGHDQESFINGVKVMIRIMVVTLGVIALLAFTPVGNLVYVKLFGAPPHLYDEVVAVARLCLVLPFIYTFRSIGQSIIMTQKRTHYMTLAMIIRMVFMVGLAALLPGITWLTGAVVGGIVWLAGMGVEALFSCLFAIKLFKKMPQQPVQKQQIAVSQRASFSFLWPLIITSFIWTFGRPMLNAGMARTTDPEQALATYQVASNFAWILIVFLENNLRQVTLIFGETRAKLRFLRKFTFYTSLTLTGIIAVLALTPLGAFILTNVIGVSQKMVENSRWTIIVLAFIPLILAWSEYYVGILLKAGRTKVLSVAKTGNLIAMSVAVFLLAALVPTLGATAGALAIAIGIGTEMSILRFNVNRSMET